MILQAQLEYPAEFPQYTRKLIPQLEYYRNELLMTGSKIPWAFYIACVLNVEEILHTFLKVPENVSREQKYFGLNLAVSSELCNSTATLLNAGSDVNYYPPDQEPLLILAFR
jgi:hypothetical protein